MRSRSRVKFDRPVALRNRAFRIVKGVRDRD
jgi:hypothetical protein